MRLEEADTFTKVAVTSSPWMTLQLMKLGLTPKERTECPCAVPQLYVFSGEEGLGQSVQVLLLQPQDLSGMMHRTMGMAHSGAGAFPMHGLILTCKPVCTIRVNPKGSPGILVALRC